MMKKYRTIDAVLNSPLVETTAPAKVETTDRVTVFIPTSGLTTAAWITSLRARIFPR